TIAGAAALAAGVLYGIGGCLIGTLWLLRTRALQWRPAVTAGFAVGGLVGAMILANAPAAWFDFDTAQSTTTFWLRQAGGAALAMLAGGLGYGLVFMAAEGLSRRAFADHPQLWRLWSRAAAPTKSVVGRTLGGYLFVPIGLALIMAFYYVTNRWFGWWQPSESLTDPNILGSAVPALSPIAISLQAGFMEECLFRAIPLSLAALVGARYGRRGLAVAIAVVVQALVFGGAHANYPGFPSYSRLVELFIPAMVWALIFLRFGLLPTILLHALFDLTLISIPLFLVDAPGSNLQRLLVVAAGITPLAIVIAARLRAGAWRELPDALRNRGWHPVVAAPVEARIEHLAAKASGIGWVATFQRALPVLGLIGLVAWVLATPFRADAPPLPISRGQAEAAADAALTAQGVSLGPDWRRYSIVKVPTADEATWLSHRFVWREIGRDGYAKVIGRTLAPPLWDVRYARFEGEVADRAEEWHVTIDGNGAVRQVQHVLPEERPGAKLSRDEAFALAQRVVREKWGLDPAELKPIGAEEKQRPARTDWTFTFADPRVDVGKDGVAAFGVVVAGDEVTGYGRFVEVPEVWQRTERERESRLLIVRMVFIGLLGVAGLAGIVMAVIDWTHGRRDRRALYGVFAIVLVLGTLGIANAWPQLASTFKTAEPLISQAAINVSVVLAGTLLTALLFGLMAGVGAWAATRQHPHPLAGHTPPWVNAIAAALFVAGVRSLFDEFTPASVPLWPTYGVEALVLPWLGAVFAGAKLLSGIGVGLFLLYWLERLTAGWRRRAWLASLLLVVIAVATSLSGAHDTRIAVVEGCASGLVGAAVVYGLLRFDYRLLPIYMAAGAALGFAENALRKGDPGALAYAGIAIAAAAFIAWGVTRYIERARRRA
ncbi:MAG TPA: hypothetical protein VF959_02070, partial [Casimicrobiaceae bacterium]